MVTVSLHTYNIRHWIHENTQALLYISNNIINSLLLSPGHSQSFNEDLKNWEWLGDEAMPLLYLCFVNYSISGHVTFNQSGVLKSVL